MNKKLTYKKAGVDIDEGERFVRDISPLVRKTFRPEVVADIGSFGALFRLDLKRYKNPVLVSGTDGVGTKLKIAFMTGRHDTVGVDLVAMCVNDVITTGAEPLFFLDYFATGRLDSKKAAQVIRGVVKGCKEAGCSLVGGETAEMPGFYRDGEYDLSGFAVGVVDRERIIDGSRIRAGDEIIGLASNGLHSNGYSLVRRLFFGVKHVELDAVVPGIGIPLGKELLKPTRIYVRAFNAVKAKVKIKGMAHITGGGLPGNLPRILPEGFRADITSGAWPVPNIFRIIEKMGNVPLDDMKRTFNMGIGYVMVVARGTAGKAISLLRKSGYRSFLIGSVEKGGNGVNYS